MTECTKRGTFHIQILLLPPNTFFKSNLQYLIHVSEGSQSDIRALT